MNDAQTLQDLQRILTTGDVGAIWSDRTLRRLASLTKVSLVIAKREIRRRFGRDCAPMALSKAIRLHREAYLRSLREDQFRSISVSGDRAKKDRLMAEFGRRGGHAGRGSRKGIAGMSPERQAQVRALALAGRKRAKAEREAARAEREPARSTVMTGRDVIGLPLQEAIELLAAAWNLSVDQAARRLAHETGERSIGSS